MPVLSKNFIKNTIADSSIIFQRGNNIYQHGSYFLAKADLPEKTFIYEVDGSYGNYTIKIKKGRIAGYRNLEMLQKKLKPIVIRRKKEDVLKDLPNEIVNNYYIDLRELTRNNLRILLALLPVFTCCDNRHIVRLCTCYHALKTNKSSAQYT